MSADIFVYLDTVQFSKNGLQNRNQIKTAQGPLWLTIPVKHQLGCSIAETEIADHRSGDRHWKTLVASYNRSPGFELWREELRALLSASVGSLADVAIASTEWMLDKLQAPAKRIRASEIPEAEGRASKLVASICRALNASEYLTGTGALSYLDERDFAAIDCKVMVQHWQSFEYRQAYERAGFVPDLSALDLLLNCPEDAGRLMASAGAWRPIETQAA